MHQDIVYTEIGKAVALIQMADHVFKSVLLLVFPGKESSDLDVFQKNREILDKATLGKLVYTLKKRVVLNDDFESILTAYLKNRNSLVHNWDEIDGWSNEDTALKFIFMVQKTAAYLVYIFTGFVQAWMEQTGLTDINEKYPQLEEFFESIDSQWKHLINDVIEDIKIT